MLFIGSHTGSQVTNEWQVPAVGTPVVQIDIDATELGRSYPTTVAVQGDAQVTLRRLIDVLEPIGPRTEWVGRTQELVQDWRQEVAPLANAETSPHRARSGCARRLRTSCRMTPCWSRTPDTRESGPGQWWT